MGLIAGSVDLDELIERLRQSRPVFHSEADFQHAFGQLLHDLDSNLRIRLEVRQGNAEYLDLMCFGPAGRTAVEFKYFTSAWIGHDPSTGEDFHLRSHAASDLARRNFVFDLARLERFCRTGSQTDGVAIMLTNAADLWGPPMSLRETRDAEFRIHEGRTLSGVLRWAAGTYPQNERNLAGSYPLTWKPYSQLPGSNGEFRWLGLDVDLTR